MRIITGFAAAAIAISGVSAPAFAETKPGTPAPTAETAEQAVAKDRRYCVMSEATGSRVPKKVCKTRAEWLSEGFDPLSPNK